MTHLLQKAALDFITDYKNTFQEFSSSLIVRGQDLSIPLEYYLHNSKEWDRRIFSSLEFEDEMGGGTISALEFWNREIAQRMHFVASPPGSAPTTVPLNEALDDVYVNGLFVKFYKRMNRLYPRGSRRREFVKKIAGFFVH